MSKIIATQVAPEWQESPLMLTMQDIEPEYISICGNDSFNGYTAPIVASVESVLHDWAVEFGDDYLDIVNDIATRRFYSTTDLMQWYFSSTREFTIEEAAAVTAAIKSYWKHLLDDNECEAVAAILTIVTGEEWAAETIRGSSQGDWNYLYFVKSMYTREDIANIEIEYFNEGDEWSVTVATDDDVCEYAYTHAWSDAGVKEELAKRYGVDVADVVLRKIVGRHTVYDYEEV